MRVKVETLYVYWVHLVLCRLGRLGFMTSRASEGRASTRGKVGCMPNLHTPHLRM